MGAWGRWMALGELSGPGVGDWTSLGEERMLIYHKSEMIRTVRWWAVHICRAGRESLLTCITSGAPLAPSRRVRSRCSSPNTKLPAAPAPQNKHTHTHTPPHPRNQGSSRRPERSGEEVTMTVLPPRWLCHPSRCLVARLIRR